MAAGQNPQQIPIDLKQSYNVTTIDEDIFTFGEPAPAIDFQGIERDGGITNNYLGTATINIPGGANANSSILLANNGSVILTSALNGTNYSNVYIGQSPWDMTVNAGPTTTNALATTISRWSITRTPAPISGVNDVIATSPNSVVGLHANQVSGCYELLNIAFVNEVASLQPVVNLGVPLAYSGITLQGASFVQNLLYGGRPDVPVAINQGTVNVAFQTTTPYIGITAFHSDQVDVDRNAYFTFTNVQYINYGNALTPHPLASMAPVNTYVLSAESLNRQMYGAGVQAVEYTVPNGPNYFGGQWDKLVIGLQGISYANYRSYSGGGNLPSDMGNLPNPNSTYSSLLWGGGSMASYGFGASDGMSWVTAAKPIIITNTGICALEFDFTAGFTSTNTNTGVPISNAIRAATTTLDFVNCWTPGPDFYGESFPIKDNYANTTWLTNANTNMSQLYSYNYAEQVANVTDALGATDTTHLIWNGVADDISNPSGIETMQLSKVSGGVWEIPLVTYDVDNKADYTIASYGILHRTPAGLEVRFGFVNGLPSFLSLGYPDQLGQLLTAVGEVDPYYLPRITDFYNGPDYVATTIVYKYLSSFYMVTIGLTGGGVQKLDRNLYKIDTISPMNIIDTDAMKLHLGSNDYNGRAIIYAQYVTNGSRDTARIISDVSSSTAPGISTGEKTILNCRDDIILKPLGARVSQNLTSDFEAPNAKIYFNLNYLQTCDLITLGTFIDPNATPDYINELLLPIPMGFIYDDSIAYDIAGYKTFIRNPFYDGYKAGNELKGNWKSFPLFGTQYVYNEQVIQALLTDTSGTLTGVQPVAQGPGLVEIAETPTKIYFRSDFDNSLYTYTGERELTKDMRLNRLGEILSAGFSAYENTIGMVLTDNLLFIRDGVISRVPTASLPLGTPPIALYPTTEGIWLVGGQNVAKTAFVLYKYSYKPDNHRYSNNAVQPLIWKSGTFGFGKNQRAILQNVVMTLKTDTTPTSNVSVTGSMSCIDQENHYDSNQAWTIIPYSTDAANLALVGDGVAMWSNVGQARIRVQPEVQRVLGASVGLSSNTKVILIDATWSIAVDGPAVIAASR